MTSPKLKKPVEALRAELLADGHTQHIAQTLGMTVEAYVERVLHYATHPEEAPVFNVLPEDQVKAQGGATVAEVQTWLQKASRGEIAIGPRAYTDGFDDPKKGKV